MAHYSIKDLEKLSGIQAHTIRIWEKRYRLIRPERTVTNIRVYNDSDLKRLLNVALLNKNGLKISKISRLSDSELNEKILSFSTNLTDSHSQIENMVLSMIDLDETGFATGIDKLIEKIGFEKTVTDIIYPFLERIGVLWQIGSINPAHEHFVSNLIRRKILVAIDALEVVKSESKQTFILFLPEGEYHEIGLLFYSYIIKKNGYCLVYLGQSVPFSDIIEVQKTYNASNLLVIFTSALSDIAIPEYINHLANEFKKQKIYIAGYQISMLEPKKGSNVVKIKSPDSFKDILKKNK
jgi:MerR family transcriptional regulator, light-induced transcriptional regulator